MTQEGTPQEQPLIDSVPGVEQPAQSVQGTDMGGQRVTFSAEEFKGNPTKVIGHPSNPATEINMPAMFDQPSEQTLNTGKPANPNIIDAVPGISEKTEQDQEEQ